MMRLSEILPWDYWFYFCFPFFGAMNTDHSRESLRPDLARRSPDDLGRPGTDRVSFCPRGVDLAALVFLPALVLTNILAGNALRPGPSCMPSPTLRLQVKRHAMAC
jgi:hypothetical protein